MLVKQQKYTVLNLKNKSKDYFKITKFKLMQKTSCILKCILNTCHFLQEIQIRCSVLNIDLFITRFK